MTTAKNDLVFIHGLGLLSPLGLGVEAHWRAIRNDRRLVDRGVIPDELIERALRVGKCGFACPQKFHHLSWDRSIVLALAAALSAWDDAGWPPEFRRRDTGLFLATSKGPALTWLAACGALKTGLPGLLSESNAWHVAMGPAALGAALAEILEWEGAVHTSVAACASALVAAHRAVEALRCGECRRAIVVAADASVHPFFESGLNNLGVLAPPGADAHRHCRPFSDEGTGFFISEAAAAICLSRAAHASPAIGATWLGSDATHLVSADAQAHSLTTGLSRLADGLPVAFVHAHATGTRHDRYELAAIRRVCGERTPVFSHKQWLGHSLGASGLVALILSAVCHRKRCTLDGRPLEAGGRSITIAQGFGGPIGMCRLQEAHRGSGGKRGL